MSWGKVVGNAFCKIRGEGLGGGVGSTSYLLPFTIYQWKLQVIVLDGFICPVQRREDT